MRLSYLRSPDGQWLLVESVDHIARVFAFSNDKVKIIHFFIKQCMILILHTVHNKDLIQQEKKIA
jgi:hypothetical protein